MLNMSNIFILFSINIENIALKINMFDRLPVVDLNFVVVYCCVMSKLVCYFTLN